VGLVEPAGFTNDTFDLALIRETIAAMGLVAKVAPHVGTRFGYLAGKDRERAADINAMYADDQVRAVFAVRGGWGSARVLPYLDWKTIRANPKLLIGFSDITALHLAFAAKAGFTTIHGPGAASGWSDISWNAFRSIAFEAATPLYRAPEAKEDRLVPRGGRTRTFRAGKASGPLIGGNLTVLTALMGTPYLPSFDGAILFLEDTNEAEYRIDRMLTQLALGGVLGRVAGVAFGQCTDCRSTSASYGGFTLSEVLAQHLEPLGVPAFEGALIGHVADQYSMPVGTRAEIDAAAGTIRILEAAVA
jgi:muramoyltetrapeptide carboxypeptidase